MRPTKLAIWAPFAFSAILGVICLVTYVATPLSGAWIIPYLCFLPMAFWFAASAQWQTRQDVKVLEARIQQLEATWTAPEERGESRFMREKDSDG